MPQSADTHIQTTAQRMPAFVPLNLEHRTHVDTASAAYHLGRKAQTMRVWASTGQGPVRPIRVNGRLSWPVAEIRRALGTA
jgi:hypothetical protein